MGFVDLGLQLGGPFANDFTALIGVDDLEWSAEGVSWLMMSCDPTG